MSIFSWADEYIRMSQRVYTLYHYCFGDDTHENIIFKPFLFSYIKKNIYLQNNRKHLFAIVISWKLSNKKQTEEKKLPLNKLNGNKSYHEH